MLSGRLALHHGSSGVLYYLFLIVGSPHWYSYVLISDKIHHPNTNKDFGERSKRWWNARGKSALGHYAGINEIRCKGERSDLHALSFIKVILAEEKIVANGLRPRATSWAVRACHLALMTGAG